MLDDIEISNKQVILGGDFNLIFDCKLETNGGNPVLKMKSLSKLIEINESLNPLPPPPLQKFVLNFIRIKFLTFEED